MVIEIGGKGTQEANLTIPQSATFTFDIVHVDEDDEEVIDHSESTFDMAFQGNETYQLDDCVSATADRIRVAIPASTTKSLPIGKMNWDLFANTTLGDSIRLMYGKVTVVDTYAKDKGE